MKKKDYEPKRRSRGDEGRDSSPRGTQGKTVIGANRDRILLTL